MTGWVKMPLDTEVDLGPGHSELDGEPAPLRKGHSSPPLFGPCLLRPNGWMDRDVNWYGGRPRPRPRCVRWEPSSPTERGTAAPPLFSPCLLWPNGRPSQQLLSSCLYLFVYGNYKCQSIMCLVVLLTNYVLCTSIYI